MSSDPLSLLVGEASSSSEESKDEEEDDELTRPLHHFSYYTPTASSQQSATSEKLPSPNTLFSAVGRPEFLTTHLQPHKVDWDQLIKNVDSAAEENIHASGNYAAIPPPEERDNDPRSEISAAPIKYAVPDVSKLDPKMMSVSSDVSESDQALKAHNKRGKDDSPPSTKKLKAETFRDKEKRKRDLGMTSRGKSFVEEEKRILRQQFGKDS